MELSQGDGLSRQDSNLQAGCKKGPPAETMSWTLAWGQDREGQESYSTFWGLAVEGVSRGGWGVAGVLHD